MERAFGSSQNWSLKQAKQIPLEQWFPNQPYFLLQILREINQQIKQQMEQGSNFYFEDYCCLVLETFEPKNYYLVPTGLMFFFQTYDIAPHSSGIPTFFIPYKREIV